MTQRKRYNLEQKALRVVDHLVSGDLVEMCEIKASFKHPFTQEEALEMSKLLTKIYTTTHSAIPEHSCYYVHDNWRKQTLKLYKTAREEESYAHNYSSRT